MSRRARPRPRSCVRRFCVRSLSPRPAHRAPREARLAPPTQAQRAPQAIPGLLVADRKAAIGSQLTGQVTAVLAREGDRVRAGQPVIRLDDRALRLEADAAAAALEAARRRMTSGATGTHVTANEVDQVVKQGNGH